MRPKLDKSVKRVTIKVVVSGPVARFLKSQAHAAPPGYLIDRAIEWCHADQIKANERGQPDGRIAPITHADPINPTDGA